MFFVNNLAQSYSNKSIIARKKILQMNYFITDITAVLNKF